MANLPLPLLCNVTCSSTPLDRPLLLQSPGLAAGAPLPGVRSISTSSAPLDRMFHLQSLGQVAAPKPPRLPTGPAVLSMKGVQATKERLAIWMEKWRAHREASKVIPDFGAASFRKAVIDKYRRINWALASGKLEELRPHVTGEMLRKMQLVLDKRQSKNITRVTWEMVRPPDVNEIDIVSGICVQPGGSTFCFVQFMVVIPSKQCYAVYNNRKELVLGDPNATVAVEDVWVVERKAYAFPPEFKADKTNPPGADWRLAGWLDCLHPPLVGDPPGPASGLLMRGVQEGGVRETRGITAKKGRAI